MPPQHEAHVINTINNGQHHIGQILDWLEAGGGRVQAPLSEITVLLGWDTKTFQKWIGRLIEVGLVVREPGRAAVGKGREPNVYRLAMSRGQWERAWPQIEARLREAAQERSRELRRASQRRGNQKRRAVRVELSGIDRMPARGDVPLSAEELAAVDDEIDAWLI